MSSMLTPSQSVPPPSPQEISRKLSVHNRPVKSRSAPAHTGNLSISPTPSSNIPIPTQYSTESDSDGGPAETQSSGPLQAPNSMGSAPQPLSAIAEQAGGSGEETDEMDQEEARAWRKAHFVGPRQPGGDLVIKSGYLWKKGERRKTWKKRWFVLRPDKIAVYKTDAEYRLLRLLDLSELHSCTPVTLKQHQHVLGIVFPSRTYYLRADTEGDMEKWVEAVNDAKTTLMVTSTQNSTTATQPIPIPSSSQRAHVPSSPMTPMSQHHGVTSESDSDDGYGQQQPPYQPHSPKHQFISHSPSKSLGAWKDPSKPIISGYLLKCRSKRRSWRKRWFVLTGEKLIYSASHMDTTKQQRVIEISQIIDALEYDLPSPKFPSYGGSVSATLPPSLSSTRQSGTHSHGHHTSLSGAIHHTAGSGSAGTGGSEAPGPDEEAITGSGEKHTFKIVTTKRPLILCAPTEDEEIKWLSAVRAVIQRCRSGGHAHGAEPHGAGPSQVTGASGSGGASADTGAPSQGPAINSPPSATNINTPRHANPGAGAQNTPTKSASQSHARSGSVSSVSAIMARRRSASATSGPIAGGPAAAVGA